MSFPARVLVVGAGPGGLTAALFLKSLGANVQVFERRATMDAPLGAGYEMNLGLLAMTRMGFKHVWKPAVRPIEEVVIRDCNKLSYSTTNGLAPLNQHFGWALRDDFITAVANAFDDKGSTSAIHLNKKLVDIHDDDPRVVTAVFEDGTRVDGDLLIGADGIFSAARRYVMCGRKGLCKKDAQCQVPRRGFGLGNRLTQYDAYMGVLNTIPGEENTLTHSFAPGAFMVTAPLQNKKTAFVYCYRRELIPEKLAAVSKSTMFDPAADRKILADALLRSSHQVTGSMQSMVEDLLRSDRIIHLPCLETPPLPRWHRNRVVLLGDAAHATTVFSGQGVNQAILDSFWYANALKGKRVSLVDVNKAAEEVYNRRRQMTRNLFAYGKSIAWIETAFTPREIALRRLLLNPRTDPALSLAGFRLLFSSFIKAAM